jgi:hypothetical protein
VPLLRNPRRPCKITQRRAVRPSFLEKRSKKLLIISASASPGRLSPDEQEFLLLFSVSGRKGSESFQGLAKVGLKPLNLL